MKVNMKQNKQEQITIKVDIDDVLDNQEWTEYEPKTKLGEIFLEWSTSNLPRHMGAEDWNLPWAVAHTQALEELITQTRQEAVEDGKREAFEEVVAFRSPYVYDEYSTLYQKSNEIRYEYFDEENKFLNKKLKALSSSQKE